MNNNNSCSQPLADASRPCQHQVRLVDQPRSFPAGEQCSLLVAMEKAAQSGIDVGCRGGGCGQCRIRVLAGRYVSKRMSRAWVTAEEEAQGIVLACRIFARSDLLVTPMPLELPHGCPSAKVQAPGVSALK